MARTNAAGPAGGQVDGGFFVKLRVLGAPFEVVLGLVELGELVLELRTCNADDLGWRLPMHPSPMQQGPTNTSISLSS